MDPATRSALYLGLIGLIIGGSVIAVFQLSPVVILPKDGTVSVYLASTPSSISSNPWIIQTPPSGAGKPNITVTSLNVVINSVSVHVANSTWTEIFKGTLTLDLLKPTTVSTLLASGKVPAGNLTGVRLTVSSATATVVDSKGATSTQSVIVSSGKLEIPLEGMVGPQKTTSITLDRPHIVVQGNGQIRLTPVLHADVKGPD